MTYHLSATRLKTYHQCPKAYYFQYECGLPSTAFFGAASLGQALHQTLAQIYRDWHYLTPLPEEQWIIDCWRQQAVGLDDRQQKTGQEILCRYYEDHILSQSSLRRPLGVEGRIQGSCQFSGIEFKLSGRYDRLDWCDDGLELIDYKSGKLSRPPAAATIDVQMGLYYLALEQHYQKALKRLTLIYLRTGEVMHYEIGPPQKQRVEALIQALALELLHDRQWGAKTGGHCDQCAFRQHCPAVTPEPVEIPLDLGYRGIQLSLQLD